MPRRGTTDQRGYDSKHKAERARWAPVVAAGQAYCTEPVCLEQRDGHSRWIAPTEPWHLAHGDGQSGYRGPAHPRCNSSEGATRGNRGRAPVAADLWWTP